MLIMHPVYSARRILKDGLLQECSRRCKEEVTSWQSDNKRRWGKEREKLISPKKEADARSWKISCTKPELCTADGWWEAGQGVALSCLEIYSLIRDWYVTGETKKTLQSSYFFMPNGKPLGHKKNRCVTLEFLLSIQVDVFWIHK